MGGGFGGIGSQRGMGGQAERSPRTRVSRDSSPEQPEKKKLSSVLDQLPEIWALLRPRRGLVSSALGMVLMAVNRVSGLMASRVAKISLRQCFLPTHQTQLLLPLVGAVLLATLVQGITSYALTQLLSKAAQRMITELAPPGSGGRTWAVFRWPITIRTRPERWCRGS